MAWARTRLPKNAFVTAVTEIRTVGSVADVGVEKLSKCWEKNVLLPESLEEPSGPKKVT